MVPSEWVKTINRLKRELPPAFPVSVRTVSFIKGKHGYTEFNGERLTIVIERACGGCNCDSMYWVLLHEWLHAMDHWHLDQQDHADTGGVYYMKAYRIIFQVE